MSMYFDLIIFLGVIVFGVGIESFLSKIYFKKNGIEKKHQIVHFKFSRYLFLISIPLLAVLVMSFTVSLSILKYFLIFAVLGTILEYCIGYSYKTVVGQRLWMYNKYSIAGHTSLLAIPLWGLCGALIYLLSKAIN
ncbi:hypothetical protein A3C57_00150 [Candidatus Nomurabacteria bacterium RIFCSPHIGHO2_02_FULL_33_12]|uniref:Uncharacterized protein n=1 Tax=Candidatus Nomurabacteria bacterium RIFCSPLOWO2_01_FULL_33_17 TaxID=1801764 RepID=A0A1F6WPW0_9BACT|nr:MAG: hypothetical protein A3C57_00150 [Candidatus Nomurabacteria bacterium RIFCSPHIGHO2_02_FULL_33_12]OGI83900.1 MAG: hypothetical protein A2903_01005 [Candidatus Nomurabacteria bacterium RIFCSPLOWO2_01_FULL_33_17]